MTNLDNELENQKLKDQENSLKIKKIVLLTIFFFVVTYLIVFFSSQGAFKKDENKTTENIGNLNLPTIPIEDIKNDLFPQLYSDFKTNYGLILDILLKNQKYELKAKNIQSLIKDGLSFHKRGDLNTASKKINEAIYNMNLLKAEFDSELEKIKKDLLRFYKDISYEEFSQLLEYLIKNYPGLPETSIFLEKQRKLKYLDFLNKDLIKYKSENNIEEQFQISNKILNIDNSFSEIYQLNLKLKKIIDKKRFNFLLTEINKNIFDENPNLALKNLNIAKKIFPEAPEISQYNILIDELSVNLKVRYLLQNVNSLKESDSWEKLLKVYSQVAKLRPYDQEAMYNLELAKKIKKSSITIDTLNSDPLKLSDPKLSKFTQEFIINYRELDGLSKDLDNKYNQLIKNFSLVSTKREFIIKSDGKSKIELRRIGKVRPFIKRELSLYPGYYTFVVSCRGYKEKVVEIEVPLYENIEEVLLVCDERI